ncbi:MAG: FtsW/RodA/SpoVE family cell cycle protein [Lachnospiraceae bacterium]|nr:FtsW/RodA/SpoVE family cell cycle protein [Lachnospiraceae bacterium]
MFRRYKLKNYNFRLIILVLMVSGIGILLVGSADAALQRRQLFGVIAGVFIMIVVSLMDYSWILNFYWLIYLVDIILLLLVIVFGNSIKGASRWIEIGGVQFQPTEISKILIVMFFAMFLMKHEENLNTWKTLLKAVVLLAVPLILIYMQPDLKNTLTIALIFCILLYVAGLSYKIMGGTLLAMIPIIAVLFFLITQTDLPIIKSYQKDRIMTKLFSESDEYSDDAIQQNNSITAIGSGKLTGKGLNNNKVSSANKGNFVAEAQNDFIFAVAGEELGFVGACGIVVLLFGISYECVRMGRRAKDLSGTLICVGIASFISIQSFINIGVATGLLPNTGTPLPFISYGLSSLISLYIGIGLILNVGLQNKNYLNNEYLRGGKIHEHRPYRT